MIIPVAQKSNTRNVERPPDRVNVYIDGFNFYYGLMAKGWGRYRWLDYPALISRRIREGQRLGEIKYFTALVTHQPKKVPRQQTYLRALEVQGGISIITGTFENRAIQCPECHVWYKRPKERQTDVNIATHLVSDAYENAFDTAYLVCADSDLIPAVRVVQRLGKRVVLIDPPKRHSDELAALADHHWHFIESHLRQCQLPNPVVYETKKHRVRRLYRPDAWV